MPHPIGKGTRIIPVLDKPRKESVNPFTAQNGGKGINVLAEAVHFQGKGKLLGRGKVRWTNYKALDADEN